MRLLAIVPSIYDTSPGQRFRIEQWAPELRKRGVEIAFEPFETPELRALIYEPGRVVRKFRHMVRAFAHRARVLRSVHKYDAVYLFREAALFGPAFFERRIERSGVPYVFDFDDAIFVPYRSPANGILSLLKCPGKTGRICRGAAHVMVGNQYLAEYARRFNHRVTVIPTTIDTDKYSPCGKADRTTGRLTIGWTGSYSTVQHLKTIRAALQELSRREEYCLRVVTTGHFTLDGVNVEVVQWRSDSEVADLLPMDIGIMPLPEDRWCRGKCACKLLQYMALGIPTVSSPTGVNTEIIKDGENGLLAASDDEWVEKLSSLLGSAELREKCGQAGRRTVEEKYSKKVHVPRVLEIFESAITRNG